MEKGQRGLSAGRVQSVAVRLLVEREREIRAFLLKVVSKQQLFLKQTVIKLFLLSFKKLLKIKKRHINF